VKVTWALAVVAIAALFPQRRLRRQPLQASFVMRPVRIAGRHHRGRQSGPHRESPQRHDRRHRAVPHHRTAPGTYSITNDAARVLRRQARRRRSGGRGSRPSTANCASAACRETITVTGESPIVDVQSTRRQQIVDDETLKALPATRGYNALVFLVPSVTGGSNQIDLMP
jgi:hypothetical protein